jgi:hypothetical protein
MADGKHCIIVKDCLLENGFMPTQQRRFPSKMMDIYMANNPSCDMVELG